MKVVVLLVGSMVGVSFLRKNWEAQERMWCVMSGSSKDAVIDLPVDTGREFCPAYTKKQYLVLLHRSFHYRNCLTLQLFLIVLQH